MKAARLYGAKDVRLDDVNDPDAPGAGEVLIRVKAIGVCGSDLHMYEDGRIGDTAYDSPLVLGHEFMGEVLQVGENALDGMHEPLKPGQRVAVDPNVPCWHCEMCEKGHPNLCPNHYFYGVYPTNGAFQECMVVDSRSCFPVPDSLNDDEVALLEPLGVAIHALDLTGLKIANSVAIIGCGPIGLLILRLAKLAGADPIYATDKFGWRLEKAKEWGATETFLADDSAVQNVLDATNGRGVDIAIEAAWADHSVQQAADMARNGGRLVLVGIPGDDNLQLQHSTARRKGLTIMMARRMKHTYPRAIQLAAQGKERLDLTAIVSHQMPLVDVPKAFQMNIDYEEGVHKIVIHP